MSHHHTAQQALKMLWEDLLGEHVGDLESRCHESALALAGAARRSQTQLGARGLAGL